MPTIKLYPKTRLNANGRAAVVMSVHEGGDRIRLGTGVTVRPEDWDATRQQVRRTDPDYARLNATLRERVGEVERELIKGQTVDPEEFLLGDLQRDMSRRQSAEVAPSEPIKNLELFGVFDDFLAARRGHISERTIAKYETIRTQLREFEKTIDPLTFKKIDQESGAAIAPHYRKYNVPEEDVEIISLTADELQLLINAVITDPRLDEARDLFLFGCFTGARYSDVSACHPDDIRGTTWHLRMHKTRSAIQIDLNNMARSIIAKYQDRGQWLARIGHIHINRLLKKLGRQIGLDEPVRITRYRGTRKEEMRGPKWQFLSTHMARKTFVTLSLERGMRPEVLMSFTGHRSFKTMKRYIAHTEKSRKEEMERVWG